MLTDRRINNAQAVSLRALPCVTINSNWTKEYPYVNLFFEEVGLMLCELYFFFKSRILESEIHSKPVK